MNVVIIISVLLYIIVYSVSLIYVLCSTTASRQDSGEVM